MRVSLGHWGGAAPPSVASARAVFMERDGILLRAEQDGVAGFGEATPLEGHTADSLRAAASALHGADLPALVAALVAERDADARAARLARSPVASSPSAAFAVECAAADLAARLAGVSLAAWLVPEAGSAPPVARVGLVGAALAAEAMDRAAALAARGLATLKLKVTGEDVAAEARVVARLVAELGVAVRLDANGLFEPSAAREAARAYADAGAELIEEPCAGALLASLGPLALPWFADESLAVPELAARLIDDSAASGVVLKPTLLGGLGRCLALARRALARDRHVVVTHAFEGPVALAACAELALALAPLARARQRPAGLDLHDALLAFPGVELPQLPASGRRPLTLASPPRRGLGIEVRA